MDKLGARNVLYSLERKQGLQHLASAAQCDTFPRKIHKPVIFLLQMWTRQKSPRAPNRPSLLRVAPDAQHWRELPRPGPPAAQSIRADTGPPERTAELRTRRALPGDPRSLPRVPVHCARTRGPSGEGEDAVSTPAKSHRGSQPSLPGAEGIRGTRGTPRVGTGLSPHGLPSPGAQPHPRAQRPPLCSGGATSASPDAASPQDAVATRGAQPYPAAQSPIDRGAQAHPRAQSPLDRGAQPHPGAQLIPECSAPSVARRSLIPGRSLTPKRSLTPGRSAPSIARRSLTPGRSLTPERSPPPSRGAASPQGAVAPAFRGAASPGRSPRPSPGAACSPAAQSIRRRRGAARRRPGAVRDAALSWGRRLPPRRPGPQPLRAPRRRFGVLREPHARPGLPTCPAALT